MTMPNQRARLISAATAVLLGAGALSACTSGPPSAQPAADDLARGLSRLDLSDVPLDHAPEAANKQLTEVVDGLGDTKPQVEAEKVQQDDDAGTATVTLSYVWELAPEVEWSYRTAARLAHTAEDGWRVAWAPDVIAPELSAREQLSITRTQPRRANILGADGSVLVKERPVVRVGIDKTQVPAARAAASARALAQVVDVDGEAFATRVEAAGPKAFVEAIVLRTQGSEPVPVAAISEVDGAIMLDDEIPLAPSAEFARPILGSVGEVTAEVVEESEGRLQPGDQAGLSGLQARYDARLGGTSGITVEAVPLGPASTDAATDDGEDARDAEVAPRVLFESDPVPGEPLRLTLDPALQDAAERLLAPVRPASAIVAVRPSSGDIVAAASGPGGGGLSTATVGRFAPGSTFKVVTALALLRAGLDPSDPVACSRTVDVDGKAFENYDDYPADRLGEITLRQAVANSCNTAFIAARDQAAPQNLRAAAAALGLGVDHDLGFPVFLGSVPADGGETDHAASMIGQARVQASPVAMAGVAASVAAGERVVPHLVAGATAGEDGVEQPLRPAEAETLRSMMRSVVSEGSATFLQDVPAGPVGAKTGTAEYGDAEPLRTHAWMIAFRGDLAVAVFVQDGESGSRTAGPILEEFLRSVR